MLEILYILDYYLPHRGGLETVFEQTISRSLAAGYRVKILTSHFDPQLPSYEQQRNLEIFRTGKSRKYFVLAAFFKGYRLLKNNPQISLIHTSTYGGAIPAAILSKIFHKKIILTVHEVFAKLWKVYKPWPSRWLFQFFESLIFSLPYDFYHCVSLYTLNSLRLVYGIPDAKLHLIHNGVDYDFWDRKKVDKKEREQLRKEYQLDSFFTLLYFGHTGVSKGLRYLVDALPQLFARYADLKIIFNLIHAESRELLVQQIQDFQASLSLEDQDRIILLQGLKKTDLRTLVAGVDGVVAPSLSEGFGSVHTETLAMETPLLTTHVASLPEVLDGKVVFMTPASSDAVVKWVAKLRSQDYSTSQKSKYFSRDENFSQLQKIYQKMSA